MMKRVIIISILFLLIFAPSQVYALEGLIKPNSPLYFLQTWGESVKLFFIRSPEQKIKYLLELTDRRVDELKNNPSKQVSNRYEEHFRQLSVLVPQLSNKDRASEKIKEASLTQQLVLAKVYNQVPEQAKNAILNAQENSAKHVVRTIEAVEGQQKAAEYMSQVNLLQQTEKTGQIEQVEQAPMEGTPNANPSQNTPKELKGANPLKEGQPLNLLNPAQEIKEGKNGNRMEPVQPIQMNQPAGQN